MTKKQLQEIKVVQVHTRDINGQRDTFHAPEWDVCEVFSGEEFSEDLEIQMVFYDGACIYSALGSDHPITWEDLIGFFA